MDSGTINLSTGPVMISPEVQQALGTMPIPHRSEKFHALYRETSDILRREYKVNHCFLLTGSGTLANEVMLFQLKNKKRGLILSNGEFGERLIDQATRIGLDFITHTLEWGREFDTGKIDHLVEENGISWIAFTHCETSTGLINDLQKLVSIARTNDCECYVDCMSTAGTSPIDLSGVAMGTASSGKGLASIPGLALLFANIEPVSEPSIPSYLDLGQYYRKSSVPFTISSNLVAALNMSLRQKLSNDQYSMLDRYRKSISEILSAAALTPFNAGNSYVFTLVPENEYEYLLNEFRESNMVVSYESDYLRKRKWIQIALFNYYSEAEMEELINRLTIIAQKIKVKKQRSKADLAAL